MYFYEEYESATQKNRLEVEKICEERGIRLSKYKLTFSNPVTSWKVICNTTSSLDIVGNKIMVDITTTPREAIWTIFNFLEKPGVSISYIYHVPKGYNKEWLSRDPGKPRIVYKLGGLTKLGVPIKLLILSGYDIDRVKQMITFFEPKEVFIGNQQPINSEESLEYYKKTKKEFEEYTEVKLFDIDAYASDHGLGIIEQKIGTLLDNSNFILTSLGPKLSAIALYRFHKAHPETALAYAPSKEFNPKYSFGIAETKEGIL